MDLQEIERELNQAIDDFLKEAGLEAGHAVVIGGSTSEVVGEKIGSATNLEVAHKIMEVFIARMKEEGIYPLVQACEHLNRCLVVERDYAEKYDLMPVNVRPVAKAGGGFAAEAMDILEDPLVIEYSKRVRAGIDIGDSFIGMHLDPDRVGVVVRSKVKKIGQANLSMIRTRERLIGGSRAVYE